MQRLMNSSRDKKNVLSVGAKVHVIRAFIIVAQLQFNKLLLNGDDVKMGLFTLNSRAQVFELVLACESSD